MLPEFKRRMSQLSNTGCPNVMTLTLYVSGSLGEHSAATVLNHLGHCSRCQRLVDDMVGQADSLIRAVRHPVSNSTSEDSVELAQLIADVEQLDPTQQTTSNRPKPRPQNGSIALDGFIRCLQKSGLFERDEVDRFVDAIDPDDSETFARQLISQKAITSFQARALLQGRWRGLVLGNYVVLEKLGQGGMGRVFKARHKHMDRLVCLKVLDSSGRKSPGMVERFRQEARTAAALNHPNIVVAHDADQAGGIPFLAMEFIEGTDLARLVQQRGPLPVQSAASLMLQVSQALQYAHEQGVVHRDVKPHNLLLDEAGTIKVLDMGLARFDSYLAPNADATTHASVTTTGVVMGTVDYMSPEQAVNSRNADCRSDIYSLGCTLYFLLTGKVLYGGDTIMEKLVAHRERDVPRLKSSRDDIPPELEAIFQQMVAKDPDKRYQSMSNLADDLQTFVDGGQPKAVARSAAQEPIVIPVNLLRFAKPSLARRAIKVSVLTMTVAALIGWIAWLADSSSSRNQALPGFEWPARQTPSSVDNKVPVAKAPAPKGHPNTLANGGRGRALVVIAHKGFSERDYRSIVQSLNTQRIDVITASSNSGQAFPDFDKHCGKKPVQVDMALDRIDVNDFDAFIFCGGAVHEFTRKGRAGKTTRKLINASLRQRRVVASIGNGIRVIDDVVALKEIPFGKRGPLLIGTPKNGPASIIAAVECKHSPQLVQTTFHDVLRGTRSSKL